MQAYNKIANSPWCTKNKKLEIVHVVSINVDARVFKKWHPLLRLLILSNIGCFLFRLKSTTISLAFVMLRSKFFVTGHTIMFCTSSLYYFSSFIQDQWWWPMTSANLIIAVVEWEAVQLRVYRVQRRGLSTHPWGAPPAPLSSKQTSQQVSLLSYRASLIPLSFCPKSPQKFIFTPPPPSSVSALILSCITIVSTLLYFL